MSSMEVNVDMLEQMDLMDMSDQEALDVFLNSGGEDNNMLSPMLGMLLVLPKWLITRIALVCNGWCYLIKHCIDWMFFTGVVQDVCIELQHRRACCRAVWCSWPVALIACLLQLNVLSLKIRTGDVLHRASCCLFTDKKLIGDAVTNVTTKGFYISLQKLHSDGWFSIDIQFIHWLS